MLPTTIISTVRHGKKHADGSLLPEGKIQSAKRALDINHLAGDIILFHSGEARVRDTIQVIGGNIHKQTPEELENILETEHNLQDYVVPTLHFLKDRNIKSTYFSSWLGETNEDKLNSFLAGEQPDDAGIDALGVAKNLAHIIHTQIEFSLLTSAESKCNFINGSHEPVIISFLYYVLQSFFPTQTPSEFLASIGGSVNYAEGFDIFIYQHSNTERTIELKFRNMKTKLSLTEISAFIHNSTVKQHETSASKK